MKPHPLCALFPVLDDTALADLAADIKSNGQREPIIVHQGQILDGQNRYAACLLAGVSPELADYTGKDPAAFVISVNLKRRHLNESQRALIAAEIATLEHGQKKADASGEASAQGDAAKMLNVPRSAVQKGRKILRDGAAPIKRMVKSGTISLSAGARAADLPKPEQTRLARKGPDAVRQFGCFSNKEPDRSAYTSAPKEHPTPPPVPTATRTDAPQSVLPTVTDAQSASDRIQAYYDIKANKDWFNSTNPQRTPIDIIQRIKLAMFDPAV